MKPNVKDVYGVRNCRGHFHITSWEFDLIYGPFPTEEEAWKKAQELLDEQAEANGESNGK